MTEVVEKVIYAMGVTGVEQITQADQALGRLGVTEEKVTRARRTTIDGLERMIASIDKRARAEAQLARSLEQLQRYEQEGVGTAERRSQALQLVTERYRQQSIAAEEAARKQELLTAAAQKYRDQLNPVLPLQRQFQVDMKLLGETLAAGQINLTQYLGVQRQLQAVLTASTREVTGAAQADRDAKKAAEEQSLAVQKVRDALNPLLPLQRSYHAELTKLRELAHAGAISQNELAAAIAKTDTEFVKSIRDATGATAAAKAQSDAAAKGARDQAAALKQAQADAQALKDRLDPLGKAQRVYSEEVANASRLLQGGHIDNRVYTQELTRAKGALDQQVASINNLTSAHHGNNAAMGTASVGARNTQFALTNLSFQVNDVVSGLASGQEPFRIFAQQAGQIVQIFQQVSFATMLNSIGTAIRNWVTPMRVASAGLLALGAGFVALMARAASLESELRKLNVIFDAMGTRPLTGDVDFTKVIRDLEEMGVKADEARKALTEVARARGVNPAQALPIIATGAAVAAVFGGDTVSRTKELTEALGQGAEATIEWGLATKTLDADQARLIRKMSELDGNTRATNRAFELIRETSKDWLKNTLSPTEVALDKLGSAFKRMLDNLVLTGPVKASLDAIQHFFDTITAMSQGKPLFLNLGPLGQIDLNAAAADARKAAQATTGRIPIEGFRGEGVTLPIPPPPSTTRSATAADARVVTGGPATGVPDPEAQKNLDKYLAFVRELNKANAMVGADAVYWKAYWAALGEGVKTADEVRAAQARARQALAEWRIELDKSTETQRLTNDLALNIAKIMAGDYVAGLRAAAAAQAQLDERAGLTANRRQREIDLARTAAVQSISAIRDQIPEINQQIAAQERLATATQQGTAAARDMEIQNEAVSKTWKALAEAEATQDGNLKKLVLAYRELLTAQGRAREAAAQNTAAAADVNQMNRQIEQVRLQAANVGADPAEAARQVSLLQGAQQLADRYARASEEIKTNFANATAELANQNFRLVKLNEEAQKSNRLFQGIASSLESTLGTAMDDIFAGKKIDDWAARLKSMWASVQSTIAKEQLLKPLIGTGLKLFGASDEVVKPYGTFKGLFGDDVPKDATGEQVRKIADSLSTGLSNVKEITVAQATINVQNAAGAVAATAGAVPMTAGTTTSGVPVGPVTATGLQPELQVALRDMIQKAANDGIVLGIGSGFRSSERQAQLFADAVAKYGSEEAARKWVAPPGRSMHERGGAVDMTDASGRAIRAGSPEDAWLRANMGQSGLTRPMAHEPWHVEMAGGRSSAAPMATGSLAPGWSLTPVDLAGQQGSQRTRSAATDQAIQDEQKLADVRRDGAKATDQAAQATTQQVNDNSRLATAATQASAPISNVGYELDKTTTAATATGAAVTTTATGLESVKTAMEGTSGSSAGLVSNMGAAKEATVLAAGGALDFASKATTVSEGMTTLGSTSADLLGSLESQRAATESAGMSAQQLTQFEQAMSAEFDNVGTSASRLTPNIQAVGGALDDLDVKVLQSAVGIQQAANSAANSAVVAASAGSASNASLSSIVGSIASASRAGQGGFSMNTLTQGAGLLDKLLGTGSGGSSGGIFGSDSSGFFSNPFGLFGEKVQHFGGGGGIAEGTGAFDTILPGSLFGETTFGQFTGGIGMGMSAGGLLNGLVGGNSMFGTIGSGIGSIAGSFLGPIGGLIGGALGGLLGGMFGAKKPPNQSAGGSIDFTTGQVTGTFMGGNREIDAATKGALTEISAFTKDLLKISGGTLSGNVLLQGGVNTGFTADSSVPGYEGRFNLGKDAGEAVRVVELALARTLEGVSDTMKTVISSVTDPAQLRDAIAFAGVYDKLKEAYDSAFSSIGQDTKLLGPFSQALDQLDATFQELTQKAGQYGLALEPVTAGLEEATRRLKLDFQTYLGQQEAQLAGGSDYLGVALQAHQQQVMNWSDSVRLGFDSASDAARVNRIEIAQLGAAFSGLSLDQLLKAVETFAEVAPEVAQFAADLIRAGQYLGDPIDQLILAITDPVRAAIEKERIAGAERVRIAQATGTDLVKTAQYNQLLLEQIWDQATQSLTQLRTELTTGSASGLTMAGQVTAANDNFNSILALVRGGNLSQLDELATAGSTAIQLSQQTYGNAPQTAALRDSIVSAIDSVLSDTQAQVTSSLVSQQQALTPEIEAMIQASLNAVDAAATTVTAAATVTEAAAVVATAAAEVANAAVANDNMAATTTLNTVDLSGMSDLSGSAATGMFSTPPGTILVGERGPELISQRGGLTIYNNSDTQRIMSMAGRAFAEGTDHFTLPAIHVAPSSAPPNEEMVAELRALRAEVKALLGGSNAIAREAGAVNERKLSEVAGAVKSGNAPTFEAPVRRRA